MLIYIYILCSKAEIFIHVAIYNNLLIIHITYLSCTLQLIVHRAQDKSWTTDNYRVVELYV